MTDVAQQAGTTAAAAVTSGIQKAEHVAETVITRIASGAVKLWHEAEAIIDADAAKVKAALPSSALPNFDATVSSLKQGASDTLSLASTATVSAAPGLTRALETAADAALATISNGVALPLVPLVNAGIDELASLGTAALQAWALKAKAQLATSAKAS